MAMMFPELLEFVGAVVVKVVVTGTVVLVVLVLVV